MDNHKQNSTAELAGMILAMILVAIFCSLVVGGLFMLFSKAIQ